MPLMFIWIKLLLEGIFSEEIVDLDEEPKVNIKNLSKALGKEINDIVVCILDRPRHKEINLKM